jgi:hypothetical protein
MLPFDPYPLELTYKTLIRHARRVQHSSSRIHAKESGHLQVTRTIARYYFDTHVQLIELRETPTARAEYDARGASVHEHRCGAQPKAAEATRRRVQATANRFRWHQFRTT